MDRTVKVRRSFLNEMRAFCNVFAQMCETCYRMSCDCPNADVVMRAKQLIMRIDNIRDADEERYFIENPNEELFARILTAIEQAGRPVSSKEIFLKGVYRQRKRWALNHLVKHGRLEMSIVNGTHYFSVGVYGNSTQQNTNKEH